MRNRDRESSFAVALMLGAVLGTAQSSARAADTLPDTLPDGLEISLLFEGVSQDGQKMAVYRAVAVEPPEALMTRFRKRVSLELGMEVPEYEQFDGWVLFGYPVSDRYVVLELRPGVDGSEGYLSLTTQGKQPDPIHQANGIIHPVGTRHQSLTEHGRYQGRDSVTSIHALSVSRSRALNHYLVQLPRDGWTLWERQINEDHAILLLHREQESLELFIGDDVRGELKVLVNRTRVQRKAG